MFCRSIQRTDFNHFFVDCIDSFFQLVFSFVKFILNKSYFLFNCLFNFFYEFLRGFYNSFFEFFSFLFKQFHICFKNFSSLDQFHFISFDLLLKFTHSFCYNLNTRSFKRAWSMHCLFTFKKTDHITNWTMLCSTFFTENFFCRFVNCTVKKYWLNIRILHLELF